MLRKVLDSVAHYPHAARNRLMLLMTHWASLRIGEVAALLVEDVRNVDESVKQEIRLDASRTKGKHARVVFLNDKLRREISSNLKGIDINAGIQPLFSAQKRSAFSANTLCQTKNAIHQRAGIEGATSHAG